MEWGVGIVEFKVRSGLCKVQSGEWVVWSVKCIRWSVKFLVECGVSGVKCECNV